MEIDKLDFDHCADEPIHRPELIQSYGFLFALDANGTIHIVSENVKELLGADRELIGENFFAFLENQSDADFLLENFERSKNIKTRLPVYVNFKTEAIQHGQKNNFYGGVYSSGDLLIIELEPSLRFREMYSAQDQQRLYSSSVAPRFKKLKSLEDMAHDMVKTVRFITKMDRVVLYKFHPDASGKVLAESKIENIDSYLDLHYPASDIPEQARELYKINWVRLMANVDLKPSRLIPTPAESGRKPLDMTHSLLRDLSPIHKQYIRNQGISSSLSMSLVTHGDLWGLISCHSKKPQYVPQNIRLECENLSQIFSWQLYAKEEELLQERTARMNKAIEQVLDKTTSGKSIIEVFEEDETEVLNVLNADGFIFYTDAEQIKLGINPHLSVLKEIFNSHYKNKKEPFYSERLSDFISEKDRLNGLCGLLMMPIGGSSKNFTAWFRKESKQVEKWAGAPNEKLPSDSKNARLTPRSSFKVHTLEIAGESNLWNPEDIDVANRFNRVFMTYAFEKQEKLRNDINYLELQNQYVNEFLATLAHELRNPLAPIAAGLSFIDQVDDAETKKVLMDTMKRQVDYMSTMIDDLMDVSRITQNKVQLTKEKLDLRQILKDAIDASQHQISKYKHRLIVNLPSAAIWVYVDSTRLNQVFVNILTNAAKYTPAGGTIELTAGKKNRRAYVKIKDNGIGLESEQLEAIFTMFTQMNIPSSRTKSGLGIGLTLVKKLLELHDAEIYAYSDGPGHGSEFEVLIPLVSGATESFETITVAKDSSSTDENGEGSVLLVDDNEDLTIMLKILLEKKKFRVSVAHDGKTALKQFAESPPDYAIIDLSLPDMDGCELCQKMKETDTEGKTIYFSHSGYGNKENIENSSRAGFKEHFVKPVKIQVLLNALSQYTLQ